VTEIPATVLVDAAVPGGNPTPAHVASPVEQTADDAEFAEVPPKGHVPALTKLLIVGIALALSFAGGVLVQKQHDAGLTSTVPAFPGGAGGISALLSGAGATGSGSSAAASGPVLVGTVVSVSGGHITVKDFGGASHAVLTSATTGLATTGAAWSTSLPPGTTVSIEGTKAQDGTVTATTITRR
jgi:hypothetical protein